MNLEDLQIAIEDLVETGRAKLTDKVCIIGLLGPELINGLDTIEGDSSESVYVLGYLGDKAYSRRVVEELEDSIDNTRKRVGYARERLDKGEVLDTSLILSEIENSLTYGKDLLPVNHEEEGEEK